MFACTFIYIPTLCVRAENGLTRLRRCADLSELLLLISAISSKISNTGSNDLTGSDSCYKTCIFCIF